MHCSERKLQSHSQKPQCSWFSELLDPVDCMLKTFHYYVPNLSDHTFVLITWNCTSWRKNEIKWSVKFSRKCSTLSQIWNDTFRIIWNLNQWNVKSTKLLHFHVSKTHSKRRIKSFECEVCQRGFSEKSSLKRYFNFYPLRCNFCTASITVRKRLDHHMKLTMH